MVNLWTEKEDKILQEKYLTTDAKDLQKFLPNRSIDAIRERAKKLGLKKNNRWTEEEDNILKTFYPYIGSDVVELIPRHSRDACTDRANRIGLKYYANTWSEEEDKILIEFYPSMGRKVYEKLIGRTPRACFDRAKLLGLKVKRRPSRLEWTEEEDRILRKYYPLMGHDVAYKLPKRTIHACNKRAKLLGIKGRGNY